MKKIFIELQKHNSEHLKILEGTRKTLEKEHERRQKLLEIHDKRMTIELDQILSRIDRKISAFYGLDITPFENTEVAYANIADMNLTRQVFASIIEIGAPSVPHPLSSTQQFNIKGPLLFSPQNP